MTFISVSSQEYINQTWKPSQFSYWRNYLFFPTIDDGSVIDHLGKPSLLKEEQKENLVQKVA